MPAKNIKRMAQIGLIVLLPVLGVLIFSAHLAGQVRAQEGGGGANNLVFNGNFEFGFYQVPELGFEPPDVGNVPLDWNWYKSDAYGKYTINNNEGLGLVCADDANLDTEGKNSLSFHMQSTDQPDARLGVYQTINVRPGVDYLFSISGTIQVQPGGSSPDINHRVQIAFDQSGNTDWRAVPENQWTNLPWSEQELEFEISGPEDPDLAEVEEYYSVVEARSDKITLFITGWRRWPNWRTAIFSFDCVSLVPLNSVNINTLVPRLAEQSTTEVDQALEAAVVEQAGPVPAGAEPAAAPDDGDSDTAQAAEPAIIPPSGGILDAKENALLLAIASVVVILGLVGAGIWNIQRQK